MRKVSRRGHRLGIDNVDFGHIPRFSAWSHIRVGPRDCSARSLEQAAIRAALAELGLGLRVLGGRLAAGRR